MKSNYNLLRLVFLLLAIPVFSQEDKPKTTFITVGGKPKKEEQTNSEAVFTTTVTEPKKKEKKKKRSFAPFIQMAYSIPFNTIPEKDKNSPYYEEGDDSSDFNIPDGIGVHFGYGMFYNSWIGISADTGIDFIGSQKLVSAPVYGTLTLTPFQSKKGELLLQASLGHAFALGRGNLSGTYQKYRIGGRVLKNGIYIYFEANIYGFPIYEYKEAGSFSIGICGITIFD
ncbi:MAG: hypothetical protein BM557_02440 [Flavobacterium sp. MedPE-SWcel]|uniref:hypothetical protein n=1 Tax=uncultured Flavobacterium sp. TaxID=165435 RepID=UPI000917CA6D|nr:hypothetical protein [uncultured Flavobacterium sp.]OIQ21676.1 MAG: hypothetical protein BM557_02440 [Flavobacterium sp. MedPE-SWcel]